MVARNVAGAPLDKGQLTPAAPDEKKAAAPEFPIVGVGASAGGLEAFEQFFRAMSAASGMAFVLVPHLDPEHASILTEILQRTTAMPVVEARDQVAVAPNHVYVIPPNREMAIFHGALQLNEPVQPRGHRMLIDMFLRSLAEDQGEHAIGVILSGTGTDGTQGLRAIVGAGGVAYVQEPATAKYDGMPSSAIRAGYATHIMSVEAMAKGLRAAIRTRVARQDLPPVAASGLNRILMLLRTGTGHDFSQYKKTTISRRIERRMSQHEIADTDLYARYLSENPAEVQALFKELLINVTSFFRDTEAFAALKQDILPQRFAGLPNGSVIRVWVAGCATGEEAYSIAILLREYLDESRQDLKVQIYATDLDEDAIATARAGIFSPNIVQDVTFDRLRRFFVERETGYRITKDIRELVVFAIHNITKDPPFTKLDLLSCRNLMIYLEPELQHRLIPAFHFALKPGGILFLSPSETIGNHQDLFVTVSRPWKVYQAAHTVAPLHTIGGGVTFSAAHVAVSSEEAVAKPKETNFAELTKRVLLQYYAPASVVTDLTGNILYVHGDTGEYLRAAPGNATLNVLEMARDELQPELRGAVQRAAAHNTPTLNRELSLKINDELQRVRFSLRPLPNPGASAGLLLLSFEALTSEERAKPAGGRRVTGSIALRRIEELERELDYTRENLHANMEEQQASNEELMSTNEEMQSTNEELQSTNEELETSKEELQSVNEELVMVNSELQAKIEQLAGVQNDMKNLLDNVNIGTVFLNARMVIRRFTRDAALVFRLVESDIGRHLSDIKSDLEGDWLLAEARKVIDTLVPFEREVRTDAGAWYLARIQPYRTLDNVIEGVVMTFVPLTEVKHAQEALQNARELAEGIVDTVREPLIVLDAELQVISASRSFYKNFFVTPHETVGHRIYELGNGQWDIPPLRQLLETVLTRDFVFDAYPVQHDFPVIGPCRMLVSGRRIVGREGTTQLILLAIEMAPPSE